VEDIAPPLKCILAVRFALKSGFSIRQGLSDYIDFEQDEFRFVIVQWLSLIEKGQSTHELILNQTSVYRSALLELLEFGMKGHSVLLHLQKLEAEIQERSWEEIEEAVILLPFKLLIPLLLFQFPAFLIILLGPIMGNFMEEMSKW
jgi:hypothetical protein